jgi:multisubunit Na+/H+ antiporter MnhF subunit
MPWFITAPGQIDILYVVTAVVLVGSVFLVGVFFFYMHSLPERLGHKKLQFEIVAVLGLLSLFTHIHLFWVIGLILALIDFPDFVTPLQRIAQGVEKLSGSKSPAAPEPSDPSSVDRKG